MFALRLADLIVPPDRQRRAKRKPGAVDGIAKSFREVGQINPITVRSDGGQKWVLVAGEGRVLARQSAPDFAMRCGEDGKLVVGPGEIAAISWGDLSEEHRLLIELHENTEREDLTMFDRANAMKRIQELRSALAKAKGLTYSLVQLANDTETKPDRPIFERTAEVNTLLKMAELGASNPAIAKATTIREAQKLIDKEARRGALAAAAKVFEETRGPDTLHRLIKGDFLDASTTIQFPSGEFDVMLTDPPYGINASKFGDMASTGHEYSDSADLVEKLTWALPAFAARVLKQEAHVYMFLDFSWWDQWKTGWEIEGFEVWPRPLIWSKGNGMLPRPAFGPRNTYECIMYANRGKKEVLAVQRDVIDIPLVKVPRHGAEKPVGLYANLLLRSTVPGNKIIDPFAGSGTIFPAANLMKCTAWGLEMVEDHYNLALSRLNESPDEPAEPELEDVLEVL
jgi:site-specific DNA-methyltransferase (adenine-specific)